MDMTQLFSLAIKNNETALKEYETIYHNLIEYFWRHLF